MGPQLATVSSVRDDLTTPPQHAAYPFPSLRTGGNSAAALTLLLPPKHDIIHSLEVFHGILQTLAIPQIPDRTRATEIEDFLFDIKHNATKEPAMLALLLAALALVFQETMDTRDSQITASKGELITRRRCYSRAFPYQYPPNLYSRLTPNSSCKHAGPASCIVHERAEPSRNQDPPYHWAMLDQKWTARRCLDNVWDDDPISTIYRAAPRP